MVSGPSQRPADKGAGVYVLVALVIGVASIVVMVSAGRASVTLSNFAANVAARPPYVPAPDPIVAAQEGLEPGPARLGERASPRIRAIEVFDRSVELVEAGRVVRTITGVVPNLSALVALLASPTWISEQAGGHVQLAAALILEPGSTFSIGAPTTEIWMQDRLGVFIGADHATLTMRAVSVASQGPPAHGDATFRPFVVADFGSVVEMVDSRFLDLGYDANASYGVSWMDSSRGSVAGCSFVGNYIGTYTDHVSALSVSASRFDHNTLYGLDPHSYSRSLRIVDDTFGANGRHGLILADHVSDSVVDRVVSMGNGENGIMLYQDSDNDVVEHSVSEGNRGDGIVVTASHGDRIVDNVVRANRVGIQSPATPADAVVSGNRIEHNLVAFQGAGTTHNDVLGNGDHWNHSTLVVVASGGAGLLVAAELVTFVLRRQRRQLA